MKQQKICIIGSGLTGLLTAAILSRLNVKIDLIAGSVNKKINNRTTAISQDNVNFLKKNKILSIDKKLFWPCLKMKLYTVSTTSKLNKIFEINEFESSKKKILYMTRNSQIIKNINDYIIRKKIIKIKKKKLNFKMITSGFLKSIKFNKDYQSKYNLLIFCTGKNSDLTKNIASSNNINHGYREVSITTILKHEFLNNNSAHQIFLDSGIMAFLPISNTETSVVWSVKKKVIEKYKNRRNFLIKKKIYLSATSFYKKIKFFSNLEINDLNLFISQNYYKDRILLFGDALHTVHPFAGQGFNMIIRDLEDLEKNLRNKINLGIDIGSNEILSEFSSEAKPRNFIYSMGLDILKKSFSIKNKPYQNIRNQTLSIISKNPYAKKFLFNLANNKFKF